MESCLALGAGDEFRGDRFGLSQDPMGRPRAAPGDGRRYVDRRGTWRAVDPGLIEGAAVGDRSRVGRSHLASPSRQFSALVEHGRPSDVELLHCVGCRHLHWKPPGARLWRRCRACARVVRASSNGCSRPITCPSVRASNDCVLIQPVTSKVPGCARSSARRNPPAPSNRRRSPRLRRLGGGDVTRADARSASSPAGGKRAREDTLARGSAGTCRR